jgi:hypothetical protein
MIIYNQAFDLYHCVFRVLQLLNKFDQGDSIEIERVRIWDFYLLFPEKVHEIRLKKDEKDIRTLRKDFIRKTNNPYEQIQENRKIFERLKTYQISALNCIASYGIINKEDLTLNRVTVERKELLSKFISNTEVLTPKQQNVISLLTSHFNKMSLFGKDGLKSRTKLLESKYDA